MTTCSACGYHNSTEVKFCGQCGVRLVSALAVEPEATHDSPPPFAVGSIIAGGRYQLDAVLGRGGMGTVYRATDLTLDRRCALKILNAELTAHPTARVRMEREARAMARIEHPNVVQVRSIFVEAELLVMEIEYMDGGDLRGQIEGGLSTQRVLTLMPAILAGLQAVHDGLLVHRDIKPANVLLSGQGVPKLADLGVARDEADTQHTRTRLGAMLGTLEYMSPEQIQGIPVDARSDLYACGIMLVQMLTGELPFAAKSDFEWQEAHVRLAPNLTAARARHAGLTAIAERALAKAPDDRWPSAAAMAAEVLHIASDVAPERGQSGATRAIEESQARQAALRELRERCWDLASGGQLSVLGRGKIKNFMQQHQLTEQDLAAVPLVARPDLLRAALLEVAASGEVGADEVGGLEQVRLEACLSAKHAAAIAGELLPPTLAIAATSVPSWLRSATHRSEGPRPHEVAPTRSTPDVSAAAVSSVQAAGHDRPIKLDTVPLLSPASSGKGHCVVLFEPGQTMGKVIRCDVGLEEAEKLRLQLSRAGAAVAVVRHIANGPHRWHKS